VPSNAAFQWNEFNLGNDRWCSSLVSH
jgi:hypothetical protein